MTRRLLLTPLLALPLLAAGCGGGGTAAFTPEQNLKAETNFVLACAKQPGATVDACYRAYTCISGGGGRGVSYQDFALGDTQLRLGQPVDPKVLGKITDCEAS